MSDAYFIPINYIGHIIYESMEVKKGLHNGLIIPTITYAGETDMESNPIQNQGSK